MSVALEQEVSAGPTDTTGGQTCHLLDRRDRPLCGTPPRPGREHSAFQCRGLGCRRCAVCADLWTSRQGGGRAP